MLIIMECGLSLSSVRPKLHKSQACLLLIYAAACAVALFSSAALRHFLQCLIPDVYLIAANAAHEHQVTNRSSQLAQPFMDAATASSQQAAAMAPGSGTSWTAS